MSTRFLGMSKIQFMGIVVAILVVSFVAQAWSISKLETLARDSARAQQAQKVAQRKLAKLTIQGVQAHHSLCVLSDDLRVRISDSQDFLKLTVAQREAKYGKALGDIPESVIKQSVANQQSTLKALSHETCPQAKKG